MTKVTRVSYNSYSGPSIKGTVDWEPNTASSHWSRVLWLTSQVESGGKFGAITMYDGTAMTAGLHQAIAVYPKELAHEDFSAADDQGSLWKLLRMLELVHGIPALNELWSALAEKNWYVSTKGDLRYLSDDTVKVRSRNKKVSAGDLVYGFSIREEFTPNQGKVPRSGPDWDRSVSWAILFHNLFSDPKGFHAQTSFGMEHFHRYCTRKTITVGDKKTLSQWLYGGKHDNPVVESPELDLALSVLWSHSVNAPAIAWRFLSAALKISDPLEKPEVFSKRLLAMLGRSSYGRWNHSVRNGRWARTRLIASRSGLWPSELFTSSGIMPRSL